MNNRSKEKKTKNLVKNFENSKSKKKLRNSALIKIWFSFRKGTIKYEN